MDELDLPLHFTELSPHLRAMLLMSMDYYLCNNQDDPDANYDLEQLMAIFDIIDEDLSEQEQLDPLNRIQEVDGNLIVVDFKPNNG